MSSIVHMKAFVILCTMLSSLWSDQTRPFGEYRWQNRIILIVEGDQPELAAEQRDLFEKEMEALKDRNLLVFTVSQQTVSLFGKPTDHATKDVYRIYDLKPTHFSTVLIGKDGGVKFRSAEVVQPLKIYGLIDQMPMRRAEMRSGGN